mgnify:CR=1 FL=1
MDERLLAFERLLNIMDELRERCPWDQKQTFETLRNLTIEETYEISSAFEHEQEIHRLIAKYGARVLGSEYTEQVCYRVAVKAGVGRDFENALFDHYQLSGKRM